ncbi:nitrophenyl compound nitroreductase subunit ArsF family protein [Shewanella kaireitica]|uniref:nitrophenyl compound nitroreductase subunit ArsF family protein n=1 Tax=Shewanella kaireitica TaxID=212021 RepID=UPI00200BC223|nr:nitrophenyl compound nitroreductase subunit ArsF family protein [Shewanella kaireitica]MCL1094049.1 nitrophenyl compound nitroreductase subunit ArsF family protein [Shewanella kaireitica]
MSPTHKIFKWLLPLAVLLSLASAHLRAETELAIAPPAIKLADNQVLSVYYFHGNVRCTSCQLIEEHTTAAIQQGYSAPLAQGIVALKVVNLEAAGNGHFIEDFQLITRSVVLAVEHNGQVIEYRRLDRVWDLFKDQQAFTNYIYREIAALKANQLAKTAAVEQATHG